MSPEKPNVAQIESDGMNDGGRSRKALVRIGVYWLVFLAFLLAALIAHSRWLLLIGIVIAIAASVATRLAQR